MAKTKTCMKAGKIVYSCTCCGAAGVKLWREYNERDPQLWCADCACDKTQEPGTIKDDGSHITKAGRTDLIGTLIPAIPTTEKTTFWGYVSTPDRLLRWWKELPLRPGGAPVKLGGAESKPVEILDLIVEYTKLSKEKAAINKRQEDIKQQVSDGLDLLNTRKFSSGGFHAGWEDRTTVAYKAIVEFQKLEHLVPEYSTTKPHIKISGGPA
jgi:hypothetical protein